jgi:hypothetical protein
VTSGYIVPDRARLRAPIQKIADFLQRALEAEEASNVVALGGRPSKPSPAALAEGTS